MKSFIHPFIQSMLMLLVFSFSINALGNTQKSYSPILIFVSFSMSDASLKAWMRQAEIIQAPVIIRGLINNSFKDTIKKMATLTRDNQGGVEIDPTLFRRFKIKYVPAVVVWKKVNGSSLQSLVDTYDVIYGNVMLSYALQKIADQHDDVSDIAQKALAMLRG